MSQPIVYLDLDRTLFQTAKMDDVWRYLARRYADQVPSDAWRYQQEFSVTAGDLYYYDMSAQLRSLEFDPAEIYHEILRSPLSDGRFEFAGCQSLIAYLQSCADVQIITYGPTDIQNFKAALCPSLTGVTISTTLAPKQEFFASQATQGWVIDDKAIWQQLPAGVHFIQVSMEGKPLPDTLPSWPIFTTLAEVEEYLQHELH